MLQIKPEQSPQGLEIHAERVRAIFLQAKMTSINSWATAILVLFIPHDANNNLMLYGWFAALTLSCVFRLIVAHFFNKKTIKQNEYWRWGLLYAAAVGTTAVVWSSSLFLLPAGISESYPLFLMMVLVALCIGASHASTTYPLVGQVYNIPVMFSFILFCFMQGGQAYYILAAMGFMFAFMMLVVGANSDKRFSEIQELRFELARKKEDAENANIAKSKFLAAASHDLRQPLHALTLFTGLLKEKITYPDVLRIVDNIDQSVDSLQGLFNSLLDISKLDAGTITIEKSNIEITQIFASIKTEFEAQAKEKNIGLFIEPCNEIIYTDPNLFSRIIRNIVSNAIRYTDEGSVLVSFKRNEDQLCIEIRDTGCGINSAHHEEIFDEFVQLHNSERDRTKGLGLGLAIVKRLTALLDIKLDFQSTLGTGTSFFLYPPIGQSIADSAEENQPTKNVLDLSLDGLLVYIIDDEATIREGTKDLIENWGCTSLSFANGSEAIDYFNMDRRMPDILLVDYRLAGNETGVDAIANLRSVCKRDIAAAIVTGDTASDRLKDAEALGHLLLHKPLKPMQLRSYLTRVRTKIIKSKSA